MKFSVAIVAVLLAYQNEAFVSWQHRCHCSALASRRQALPQPMYATERYYDEEDPYETKCREPSREARELRRMRYEEYEDYYDNTEPNNEVDDTSYGNENGGEGLRRTTRVAPRGEGDDYEDPEVGNFWSNPAEGLDPYPNRRLTRARSSSRQNTDNRSARRPRSRPRTTFRSGEPRAPDSIEDFYERLFWYGFDTKENMAVGDKTLFGGTKGKFNGLQFLGESTDRPHRRKVRETPEKFRADEWYDDMMDSIEERYGQPSELEQSRRRPPVEDDYFAEEYADASRKNYIESFDLPPSPRKHRERSEWDWASREVSGWFGRDDFGEQEEDELLAKMRKRKPRRKSKESSPWTRVTNVLDSVFGIDRGEVDMNAAAYNRQMGLGPKQQRRTTEQRRGPGYAYRYVEEEEDSTSPVADYESTGEPAVIDAVEVEAITEEEAMKTTPTREKTWEERAAAFERVPPSGIPAWGPLGEVGVDARSKATLDALEDLREATRHVELAEERCIDAKEDIVVLKADIELQKKRLQASKGDPRRIRSRIRQMQDEIDDASRTLRRVRAEEDLSRKRLAALEEKHWALLSLYDADKAFREVVETFREFEESERPKIGVDHPQEEVESENSDVRSAVDESDSQKTEGTYNNETQND